MFWRITVIAGAKKAPRSRKIVTCAGSSSS
jgi:hypothetical protein